MRLLDTRTRYIYVLRRIDEDTLMPLYKIGMSYTPRTRAVKCDAELLHIDHGGREHEQELHRQFAHLAMPRRDYEGGTEWFCDDTGEIAEWLATVTSADDL